MTRVLAAAVTLAALLAASSATDGSASPERGGAPGVIEGVVRGVEAPPRRVGSRYPGAGGAARTVQEIPPVVFLKGEISGTGAGSEPTGPPVIAQEDTTFVPSLVVVARGGTVEFPNHDPFFHNVFSYSPPARFDLGRYPRGESKSVTFDRAGVVKVYCEVHDFMRSAVVVVDNAFHDVPDEDGRFRIAGVPAGTHTLVAWHADRGRMEREITVPDGGVVRVELEL